MLKQNPIERALYGDGNTDYVITNPKRWNAHIKRSKARFKTFPQWVIDHFTPADLKQGFMLAGMFYQPMYSLFSNGLPLITNVPKAEMDSILAGVGDEYLYRGRKLGVTLTGFKHVRKGELTNDK